MSIVHYLSKGTRSMATQTIPWSSIVQKALPNAEFKKALVENPRAIIEREAGVNLPEGVEYFVHEQTANQIHLVLPPDKRKQILNGVFYHEESETDEEV
jgi:hypothetical protein